MQHRGVLPRRVAEATRCRRQPRRAAVTAARAGFAGGAIAGFIGQKLEQPLRRAGGLGDLAPDLRQLAERARRQHGVEQELAEPACR